MLYVAAVVNMPDGMKMRSRVVVVEDGVVKDIHCFSVESPSMLFVEEVYISPLSSATVPDDMKKSPHPGKEGRLYAYRLCASGRLQPLL